MLDPTPGRPRASEYGAAHERYVDRVPDAPILDLLSSQKEDLVRAWSELTRAELDHRYAEGKWSVAEVLGHVIDLERIFGYRALVIARRGADGPDLPGHDEERLVSGSTWAHRPAEELAEEFAAVRAANRLALSSLRPEEWTRTGTADGVAVSVRALAHLLYGHADHHRTVIEDRYL